MSSRFFSFTFLSNCAAYLTNSKIYVYCHDNGRKLSVDYLWDTRKVHGCQWLLKLLNLTHQVSLSLTKSDFSVFCWKALHFLFCTIKQIRHFWSEIWPNGTLCKINLRGWYNLQTYLPTVCKPAFLLNASYIVVGTWVVAAHHLPVAEKSVGALHWAWEWTRCPWPHHSVHLPPPVSAHLQELDGLELSEWMGSDSIKAWAEPVKLQQQTPTGREGGKERDREGWR